MVGRVIQKKYVITFIYIYIYIIGGKLFLTPEIYLEVLNNNS